MENAKKFFEEVAKTEEAKALFAAMEAPKDEEARFLAYIDIANKLGIALTLEDIAAYLQETANQAPAENELDDEELQQLVGGGENAGCKGTYQHKENCWWTDACDLVNNQYGDYQCSHTLSGEFFFNDIADWFTKTIKKRNSQ